MKKPEQLAYIHNGIKNKINHWLNSQILLMFASKSEKLLTIRGVSSSLSATTVCSYPLFRNMARQKTSPIPPNVRTGRLNHIALILITHRLSSRKRLKPHDTRKQANLDHSTADMMIYGDWE